MTEETKKEATRAGYGKALVKLAENKDVVVLDADLAKSTTSIKFAEKDKSRFFDVGISEQDLIGTAAGLALCGKVAFASTFAVFATGRAYDQIRASVAYPKLNVKIVGTHAGVATGEDGASHQALEDIALMRALPNMVVISPADVIEAEAAVLAAAKYKGPVYIRLNRPKTPVIFDESYKFELGKAVKLKDGADVTIIATGLMVSRALDAADDLAKKNIEAEVINLHTIKPLDGKMLLKSVKKTGCVVTAEDHNVIGGVGGAIAELLAKNMPAPMEMVGMNDTFGESGKGDELLEKFGLTSKGIIDAVLKVIDRRNEK